MVDPLMAQLLGDLIKRLKIQLNLTSIVGGGDLVIGTGVASGSRNGDTMTDEPYAHVAKIKDGKMAEAWIVNLNQDRVDKFYNL